jgi:O-antigen/teichoic acid export membrane protein
VQSTEGYEQMPFSGDAAGNLCAATSRSQRFERLAGTEDLRANLKAKSIHGALFCAAGAAADFVLRFAATVVLARLLIPEQWGLVGMVTAITAVAEQFRDLGLCAATVQRKEISHEQVTNLFWINVLAGFLIALVISALAPAVSAFYGDSRLMFITIAMATNFFWGGLTVQHNALLARQMKLPQIATLSVAANLSSAILAITLALNHYGYWALVWREMARSLLLMMGTWALCPWVPGLPKKGADIGSLLRFGRDISVTAMLEAAVGNLGNVLIGRLCGAAPLGLYRQGYQLIMAPVDYLFGPIRSVGEPGLSAVQADPARYRRYYDRIVFFVSSITVPLGLFVAIYAQEITLLVLGPKWVQAATFLRIFALATSIRPTMSTCGLVLMTSGKSKTYLFIVFMQSVTLVLCMLVGMQWGAEGITMAHLARALLMIVPTLHYSLRQSPVSIGNFMATVGRPLVASLAMSATLFLLRAVLPYQTVFASVALGGVMAMVSYPCAWTLLPGGVSELRGLVADLAPGRLVPGGRSRKGAAVVEDSAS